ncbi:hypothetical protein V8F63_14580 [Brevundimonas sp. LF-1]|uniref:hypothetical protein n=1 Tax=Brevundimonas sp. LF-1 TaxID=3126100 RepID=UPI0030E0ADBD
MALEPEFWAILDAIGAELSLSRAGLMIRIDDWRGRRPWRHPAASSPCNGRAATAALQKRRPHER